MLDVRTTSTHTGGTSKKASCITSKRRGRGAYDGETPGSRPRASVPKLVWMLETSAGRARSSAETNSARGRNVRIILLLRVVQTRRLPCCLRLKTITTDTQSTLAAGGIPQQRTSTEAADQVGSLVSRTVLCRTTVPISSCRYRLTTSVGRWLDCICNALRPCSC